MINFESQLIPKRQLEKMPNEILLVDSDLSTRAYQSLNILKITNLEELANYSAEELIAGSSGINQKIIQEINELLAKYNLSLLKGQ